ncbi:T9SS type A sorting domain-containing protein [Lutibacter sp. A80]|uniref:T9SS type A sorting domain-containing protein n=1 Tax=Lutibacter sp. A80 TaxID=2918453 RepID=UPI001F056EA3|nr:T9SS type A sorting domain-containing protein [Lutibacter sp. A80]UMB59367.1 T9SS type A sorting domain-containing protein [Lutibacter sp. A80]
MKTFYILVAFLFVSVSTFGGNEKTVFLSEINYTGSNPFIELSVSTGNGKASVPLNNLILALYNSDAEEIKRIYLKGTLKEGEFLIIDDENFDADEKFDANGGVAILYEGKGKTLVELESVSFGDIINFNKVDNIGSTSGEVSLQKTATGWIPSGPTPGAENSSKSLSVVKDQIEGFNIYPNPVKDGRISISTKNSLNKNVVIYSILGSVVYNKAVKANELINVENLSTGLYLVQVEEDDKVSVRKVLIN